ncbi:MAG: HAD-IIB family hydrolase [bacterium]|nr:HAD-IIB family hydrolase [bacterium]
MNNLLTKIEDIPKDRKVIVFDLDGTLVNSKSEVDGEMAELITKLLEKKQVAVIGGGKYELFQKNLVSKLNAPGELLKSLFLFPLTSTTFYRYENDLVKRSSGPVNSSNESRTDSGGWKQVYAHEFSPEQKDMIYDAFKKVFTQLNYMDPERIYGEIIEDRGSQITFSALGQFAPLDLKDKWKKENEDIKLKITQELQRLLPDMEVRAAGFTSIDVTAKGIDKEYGMNQIKEHLGVKFNDMLFFGDALFEHGNDHAVLQTNIPCFQVNDIEDTKKLIRHILSN